MLRDRCLRKFLGLSALLFRIRVKGYVTLRAFLFIGLRLPRGNFVRYSRERNSRHLINFWLQLARFPSLPAVSFSSPKY